jgi:hypothetical protein
MRSLSAEGALENCVAAAEIFHCAGDDDLHFRFIGTAKGHLFVLNIQFEAVQTGSGKTVSPGEHKAMIVHILGLVRRFAGSRTS